MATQRHRPMNTSPPPEDETYRTLEEDIAELTADDRHVTDEIESALDSAGDFVKEIYDIGAEKRRLHTSDDIRSHPAVLAMTPEGRTAFLVLPKRERERMLKKAEKQVLSQSKASTPDIGIRIRTKGTKVARTNNQPVTTSKATVNAAAQTTTAAVRTVKTVARTTGTTVKAAGTGAGLAAAPATAGITVAASAVANVLDSTLKKAQIAQNLAHTQAVREETKPRYAGMIAGVLAAILPAPETRKENLPIGFSFTRLLQMIALLLLVGVACIMIPISFISGLVLEHTNHLMNCPERFTSVYGRACISTMEGEYIESVLDQLYEQKLTGLANAGVSDSSLEDYQTQRAEVLCLYAAYRSSATYSYDSAAGRFLVSGGSESDIKEIFTATDENISVLREVFNAAYPDAGSMDYEAAASRRILDNKQNRNYRLFLQALEYPPEDTTEQNK